MTAERNIATIKAMYEAFGRGDVDAILELVTDDVDWATDAAVASAPWHGPKHGKDGVRNFFEGIARTGPVTEFEPLGFAGNADGDVMVFLRYAFTATATGRSARMHLHHYWRFRDGKVWFVRSSEDTALVAATLGRAENLSRTADHRLAAAPRRDSVGEE
jgi:ketosteroid isomerase-like protein